MIGKGSDGIFKVNEFHIISVFYLNIVIKVTKHMEAKSHVYKVKYSSA